mgnify:CR=1 FL=1
MNALLDYHPTRRAHFSLLLNRDEYTQLSELSNSMGLSRGSLIRIAVRNLVQTRSAGKITTPMELDSFWKQFRGGQTR